MSNTRAYQRVPSNAASIVFSQPTESLLLVFGFMNRHGIGCYTDVHCYGCGCNDVSLLTVTEPEKHVIGGDVWFRFKEGYTNAVRKNVRVQDLI